MSRPSKSDVLETTRAVVESTSAIVANLVGQGRTTTEGGKRIDDHQPAVALLAELASSADAARANLGFAETVLRECGDEGSGYVVGAAGAYAGQVAARVHDAIRGQLLRGLCPEDAQLLHILNSPDIGANLVMLRDPRWLVGIGKQVLGSRGRDLPSLHLPGDLSAMRESIRRFADTVVRPLADEVHRHDKLVPESFISGIRDLGLFGLSVPEEYGGSDAGSLAMLVGTEELSAASLAAAGSLMTRPEIAVQAVLGGGSEEQKKRFLPRIAEGVLMFAISVTEPGAGSDVAGVRLRAEQGTCNGTIGYYLTGEKTWCTFAGRADVIEMLVRTDPNPASGYRGLSILLIEKEVHDGHEFQETRDYGSDGVGTLTGKAIPTPGYRGMHSFALALDHLFVPATNRVGAEGEGFKLQMRGFESGRLQTAARATGVAAEAVEVTARYASERIQFGKAIGDYGDVRHRLGWMAVQLQAMRSFAYAAAEQYDSSGRSDRLVCAEAKLMSCSAALSVARMGQIVHGGYGYGDEYTISRLVSDAGVLSLFEGVEPTLALAVIGRALLAKS